MVALFHEWNLSFYTLPSLLSGFMTFFLGLIALKRRVVPGATPFILMMFCSSLWAICFSFSLSSASLDSKVLWFNLSQIGAAFIPPLHFFLALEHSRRERLVFNTRMLLFFIVPLFILFMMWTNERHYLLRRSVDLLNVNSLSFLAIERGPLFWVEISYTYILIVIAMLLLLKTLVRETFKQNTSLLFLSFLIPIFSNILDVLGLNPLNLIGSTVVVFSISGLLIAIGLFYAGLFDIAPIAHAKIIEGMRLGIIVVDRRGRIVDLNPKGRAIAELFSDKALSLFGYPITSLFTSWGSWIEDLDKSSSKPIALTAKGYTWEMILSPLFNHSHLLGYTATFYDLTRRMEYEKKIEEYSKEMELQNRELETLYQQLDQEIQKAAKIHKQTLPDTIPYFKDLAFAAYYEPAISMGGDSYYIIHKDNKAIFYLSDVTGHGLDGAMLSIFLKEAIHSYIALSQALCVENILHHLDSQFRQENFPDDYAICIFFFIIDLETMEMSYKGVGFNDPPLLMIGNERRELVYGGLPISKAVPRELLDFRARQITLERGSTLLVCTDGITEQSAIVEEGQKEMYGQRLKEAFFRETSSCPLAIIEAMKEDFYSFNHHSRSDDDITLIILKVHEED